MFLRPVPSDVNVNWGTLQKSVNGHVSLGYTLCLHDSEAFVNAVQVNDPPRVPATMAARSAPEEKATALPH